MTKTTSQFRPYKVIDDVDAYDIMDSLSTALDVNKFYQIKMQALDELFSEPQEGQLRMRQDGSIERFAKGKWTAP